MTVIQKLLAFGADHAGVELKNKLLHRAQDLGWQGQDFGTYAADSVDYPDYAHKVARAVADGHALFGVLVCGSGTGMTITANKHPEIRAANCWTAEIAKLAREHNDANILCIPARFIDETDALMILETFLTTDFAGGRHAVRVGKINC